MRIRDWLAHLKKLPAQESSDTCPQMFEQLEQRLLLSVTMPGLHGPYEVGPELISPMWFQEVQGPPAQPSALVSGSALATVTPNVVQTEWEGQSVEVRPYEWIVQLTSASLQGIMQIEQTINLFPGAVPGFRVIRGLGMAGQLLLHVPQQPEIVKGWLQTNLNIAHYGPNVVLELDAVPNDTRFPELWGMHNTGQTGGTNDADIDAPEAWDVTTGSSDIVVGVIDTGVDYTHPDLAANMWTNPGEIPNNGVDDDGNGFIDDYYGYDFGMDDSDPMDDVVGHGTHVSGTIAAVGNNSLGVVGVNWSSSIMALKIADDWGGLVAGASILALNYASTMRTSFGINVRVTNNSYGGYYYSQAAYDAILANGNAGILFVAAAGNESNNNDIFPAYPASYDLDNIISVAATDHNDQLTWWSNYGRISVDVGAPGDGILSTVPGGGYESWPGTSMACPHVVGVSALAWSLTPTATYTEIRDAIFAAVDYVPSLAGRVATGGRVNAFNTLMHLGNNEIRGLAWNDTDRSGTREGGEDGISQVTVYLDANDNGVLDYGERSETTITDGTYSFAILAPGDYAVRVVSPQAWMLTYPGTGVHNVSVSFNETIYNIDFGAYDARPTATPQAVTILVGDPVPVDIALVATDDQTPLNELVFSASSPQHGQVVINGNVATYTPDPGYEDGLDSFDFVAIDTGNPTGSGINVGTSPSATVSISVFPINDDPIAQNTSGTTDEEAPLGVILTGTDEETSSANLTYAVSVQPANGTVTLVNNVATYTPNADFNGTDYFQFTVTDTGDPAGSHANPGDLISNPATVTVTVNPINDAPTAVDQFLATGEDAPLGIVLSGTDVETPPEDLVYTLTQAPAHGSVVFNANQATYTPAPDYAGADSFQFIATDTGDPPGVGTSPPLSASPATVSITVDPVNDKPTANAQTVVTNEGNPVVMTLGGTDVETVAGQLTYNVLTAPAHGVLTQLSATEYQYVPDPGYSGLDSVQFSVTDDGQPSGSHANPGDMTSDPAAVTIAVARAESLPSGARIPVLTPGGTTATVMLTGPGTGTIYNLSHLGLMGQGVPGIAEIVLTGTSELSSLMILSRDTLAVGKITVQGGSLMRIWGYKTDLLGDIDVSGGTLGFLMLHDVKGPAQSITIGAPTNPWSSVFMRFNSVDDLSINSGTPIRYIYAAHWTDTDGTADEITAPRLDMIMVMGNRLEGLGGDFSADVTVTGAGARYSMLYSRIVGNLINCDWDITGNMVGMMVMGQVNNWTLNVHSNVTSLWLGNVVAANVTVDGTIGYVYAKQWSSGSLQAHTLRTLLIPGSRWQGINGDFGAALTLSGGGIWQTLSYAYVVGDVVNTTWNITGDAGTVFVSGAVDNWTLNVNSNLWYLRLGNVISANVTVDDGIGVVWASQWLGGSLQADTVRSLLIMGNRLQGLTGDFGAAMTLNGAPGALRTLWYGRIVGTLTNAANVQGSTGYVTLGGLSGDLIITGNATYVLVQDPLTAAPPSTGEVGKVQVGGTARVSGTAGTVLLTNDTLYTRPGKTYRLEELRQFDTPGSWWDYQVLSSGSSGSKAVTGTAQVFSGGTTEVVTTPTGDGTLVETWETTSQGRALQTSKVWWTGGNEMELIFNTPLLVTPETVEVGRTYSGSARFKGRWTIAQGNLEFFGNCTGTAQIQTKVQEHKQQTVQTGIYLAVKGETVMTASGYVEFRDHNGSFRHGPFTLKVTQTWWGVPGVGIVKGDVRVTVQVTTVGGLRCYYNVTSQRNLASLGTGRPSVPVLNDDFPGHSFTGMYPPDPIAAAGPSNIMAVVNSRVGIWSKTGTSIAAANLNEFFVEVDYGFGPFDPWIVYDRYSQRYIVMAEEVSFDTNKAFVLIAISTTSNPDDLDTDPGDTDNDWYVYRIPATYDFGIGPAWIDYPKIAADADSLYITGNYFRFNDRRFQGTVVTRLDKTPMLTGMPGTRTDRLAPGAFTLQPAQSIGRPASAPQLFVDCGTNYGQGVTVWEMDDSNALTQVTTLSAPFSGSLAGATQPITTDTIDTVSVRLMNAVWRDNSLWATHTVDVDGDATVRWYQIDTTNGIYTLVQRSDINPGLGIETYMPAIAVDSAGNMAITYTQSSATQYASMMYTARRASDPLGFTPPGAVIKAGVTYYNPSVSTVERWGDYGGIAVDPSDDLTFWAFHEYVATTATWDTWWGTFAF